MNSRLAVPVAGIVTLVVLLFAAPALAYDELAEDHPLKGTRSCYECHGLVDGETTQTVDPASRTEPHLRKGPHGGYTSTTSKCSACHTVHSAPAGGELLLPGATVQQTCTSCHDGTGGRGVYGVVKARTGIDPSEPGVGASHRVEVAGTNLIPGGASDGTTRTATFTGPGGTLTCSDCHSPHDANTVQPFRSDRFRTSSTEDTLTAESMTLQAVETNRLLKKRPTSGDGEVAVYGTGWCRSCHQGHSSVEASGSVEVTQAINHPVQSDDTYHYGNLPVVTGPGERTLVLGALGGIGDIDGVGGNNRGFVMPHVYDELTEEYEYDPVAEAYVRPPLQQGSYPICQQCHSNNRRVGEVTAGLLDATEEFKVTAPDGRPSDGAGGSTDNPRFQTFPHESEASGFLVVGDGALDNLCRNCHAPQF